MQDILKTLRMSCVSILGGKSAVVTGLVVGLGGNAGMASRGTRVSGFVKTGKQ
jgi:hypothetical protein